MTGVCRFHCYNLGVTERHRVAYHLRTAAEGPGGTEQWWTVGKCRQRRLVAQGRILGGTLTVHGVTADECEPMRTDCVLP